jgi:predicted nuclease of predicted toxin-antitoxin system
VRILADENVPGAVVIALRADRHDIARVAEDAPRSPDAVVLARAQAERRLVLTSDKDFGELAFRDRLPAESGVVLVRADATSPSQIARLVTAAIASRSDWEGHFSVVENDQIRMTPLP